MPLNEAGNPYKCPCCWPCDTIPLCTSAFPNCPSAYYCGPTRRENNPGWATPTYTPKCKIGWNATGADCVFWSQEVSNPDCNCTGVWAQYCTDDAGGTNGRAWVVEFFCIDGVTQAVNVSTYVAQDWVCACGDVAGQLPGAGPRFQFFIEPTGCCCECGAPDCTCAPPATLYVDVSGCWSASGVTLTSLGNGCWSSAASPAPGLSAITLCCADGSWTLYFQSVLAECVTTPTMAADAGTCDPFYLTFPDATLSSSCCPPSGGTVSATVSE